MISRTALSINNKIDYLKLLSPESNLISEIIRNYYSDIDQGTLISFENIVSDDYLDQTVFDFLINGVGKNCSRIEIEYPYYDSDYLSVLYIHYSHKFLSYSKKCYRIHFYSKKLKYCGYIVLRPILGGSKIGRSCLAPDLFESNKKYLLKTRFIANVCGDRREVEAFPWKHQETDVAVCAHVALWNILKYFGNKYTNYRDTNIGDIVNSVEENEGRKTPTKGLTPIQASYILKQYGFSPVIINQNKESILDFKEELLAYVESGIPVLAFLNYKGEHAVTIMGHGEVDSDSIAQADVNGMKSNAIGIEDLVVMDDNYAPYRLMPFSMATKQSEVPYCATHIEYYVVPLYDRMQMDFKVVKTRMNDWVNHKVMNWEEKNIYRIYITSSKSLKEKTKEDLSMDGDLKEIILGLSLPKFVWCIDFSTENEYINHLCSGKIVIDATSENYYPEPWILRHDDRCVEYKDYDEDAFNIISKKRLNSNPYKMYINNLKEE